MSDSKKMREALKRMVDWFKEGGFDEDAADEMDAMVENAESVLDAPPRNFDVGTPLEIYLRHKVWCGELSFYNCHKYESCRQCFAEWGCLPYGNALSKTPINLNQKGKTNDKSRIKNV